MLQRAAGLALYTFARLELYTIARLELYTPSPSLGLNFTPITHVRYGSLKPRADRARVLARGVGIVTRFTSPKQPPPRGSKRTHVEPVECAPGDRQVSVHSQLTDARNPN